MQTLLGERDSLGRKLRPERHRALCFLKVRSELAAGVVPYPSSVTFEFADTGKLPPRQGMPFLSDLIEANSALHGCHRAPPGTRYISSRVTENYTKTMAYS